MCRASAVGEETKAGRAIKVCLFSFFINLKLKLHLMQAFLCTRQLHFTEIKAEIYKHTKKCESN